MASLNLKGAVSGQVALTVPAEAGATTLTFPAITGGVVVSPVDFTLPASLGVNGQALTTNGAGMLSWATVGGGGGGVRAIKTVTTNYTLELADANYLVQYDSVDPGRITVPPDSEVDFPIGTMIEVSQINTGSLNVFGDLEGAQVYCPNGYMYLGGTGYVFNSINQSAILVKTAADTWNLRFYGYGNVLVVPTAAQETIEEGGEFNLNWAKGKNQRILVNGNFSVTVSPGTAGFTSQMTLEVINTGAYAVTWPLAIVWPNGIAPVLTTAGVDPGRDIFTFTKFGEEPGDVAYGEVVGQNYS